MLIYLGWLGSTIYLVNHAYLSCVRDWKKTIYFSGNFVAALALVISSWGQQSYQAVGVNLFWLSISLMLLLNWPVRRIPASKKLYYLLLIFYVVYLLVCALSSIPWDTLIDRIAWTSTWMFGMAYLLFSAQKMRQMEYLFSNAVAAVILVPQLWLDANYPVFFLEVCWFIISLAGIVRRWDEVHLID